MKHGNKSSSDNIAMVNYGKIQVKWFNVSIVEYLKAGNTILLTLARKRRFATFAHAGGGLVRPPPLAFENGGS